MSPGQVRIGISGWRYEPWRGVFYPGDLPQRRELAFASRALHSIELNGSFYALQKPGSYAQWHDDTPDDFVFSVKAPKYITHVRRLREVEEPIANFFASGVLALKDKLGPILWQFPPSFTFDAGLFEAFLRQLPHDTETASRVARHRSDFMKGRDLLDTDARRPVRHAVEIRHKSFEDPAFAALLREHKVALVVADTAGKWPFIEEVCADFMYLRLHGDEVLYASGYSDEALARWARRITAWREGHQPGDAATLTDHAPKASPRDVYCYFDNDIKVKAPFDAAKLMRLLGQHDTLTVDGHFEVRLP
ncbi:MAG: DUF72 domain-containing protein [Aquabacterium sp.]